MKERDTLNETSASMGPTRLAEPPPARSGIADRDAARWVAAGVVGFGGFASAAEAAHAAWIAHRTLARRDAQSRGAPLADADPPTVARRHGRDLVIVGGHEIASLVSAGADAAGEGRARATYGFELRLLPPADELHARAASYLIDRELRSSRPAPAALAAAVDLPAGDSLAAPRPAAARTPSACGGG